MSEDFGSEIPPGAPDRLAELTGRDAEEFRADDYDIPDFEDQDIIVPDGGETDGQYADDTDRSVALDIHCGDERVERLRLTEGESFDAEVDCPDYSIEVVSID